ncbi:MAG: DUF1616 domain-containing protein [Candidatus Methanomethylicus sp.]|nr:DUF1616 domain-containing protein [Candidatus Methanomethylicus sp.]
MEPALDQRHLTNMSQIEDLSEQPVLDSRSKQILESLKAAKAAPTLGEYVSQNSKSLGMSKQSVAKRISSLREQSMIEIRDPAPPATFTSYASSVHSLWFWLVLVTAGLAILSIYAAPSFNLAFPRYILGSAFIFFLPGYALVRLLYPKQSKLSHIEGTVLSVGLSLALVSLGMIVLSYLPGGITLDPIVIMTVIITGLFALLAMIREYR